MLDDGPLQAMVGRTFPSFAAAAKHAGRLLKGTQRKCPVVPIWLLDDNGTGNRYWTDGSVA